MKYLLRVFLAVTLLGAFPLLAQQTITIDGDMLDWAGIAPADTGMAAEEVGDMVTGPDFDLKDIYIASDDSMLYFRIVIDPSGSFTNAWFNYTNPPVLELYLDHDIADTSGLAWGWWTTAINYFIPLTDGTNPTNPATEVPIIHYTGNWAASVWPDDFQDTTGFAMVAVSSTDNEIEVGVPKSAIDLGTNVRPIVYSVGDWIWAQDDLLPNGQTTDPAWMIDYYTQEYRSVVYQHKGPQISSEITIDGDMFDWAGISAADVGQIAEETGDMPTGPEFDIKDFYITSDSSNVYVRIAIDPAGTFTGQWTNYTNPPVFELWFDTFLGDTMGLGWGGFWIQAGDYKIELQHAYNPTDPQSELVIYHYSADYNGAFEDYDSVGVCMAAVNGADNEIEVQIPRNIIVAGSDIRPFVYSVGDFQWDNEEYYPDDQTNEVGPSYVLNYNFITGAAPFMARQALTAIGDKYQDATSNSFVLEQNYPNPFNPSTTIQFVSPTRDRVELIVSNVLGQTVKTLYSGVVTPGVHQVVWDGTSNAGSVVASGIYFYVLKTSSGQLTRKMLFLR